MMLKVTITAGIVFFSCSIFGQNIGINSTGANPAASAMLDVVATDRGLLVPRLQLTATNVAAPITSPETSLLVYNLAAAGAGATAVTAGYYYNSGTAGAPSWVRVSTDGSDWRLLGNSGTTSGTNFLGTTDGQALDFRTNNNIRFRVANADQVHAMADGSEGAPFYSWDIDRNSGMYRIGADDIGIATTGRERVSLSEAATIFNENSRDTDFRVESNGVDHMLYMNSGVDRVSVGSVNTDGDTDAEFNVTGNSTFSDDIRLRDGATNAGSYLIRIYDSADDGVIDIYEGNAFNHRLHGNAASIYNEQGLDIDYRFESNNNANVMRIDAGNDIVRFGSNTGTLTGNGFNLTAFDGSNVLLIDYVADFDNGAATGTAFGIGSLEFFADGNNELFLGQASFSSDQSATWDIGSLSTNWWDDIYADDFWNVSDSTMKKNIEELPYGLNDVLAMKPVTYLMKNDPFQEQKIGLLAQELLPIVKESVKTHEYRAIDEDPKNGFEKYETPIMAVSYVSLVPVLIQALKDEDQKVEELTKRIEKLEQLLQEK